LARQQERIKSITFIGLQESGTKQQNTFTIICTKFDFGWGSTPDPAGGAYSASPDPVAGFKGPTSKGRGGN